MASIALFKNTEVEILDLYEMGGVEMAVVQAVEGRPFTGGDRWPVKTDIITVPADAIKTPTNGNNNLLERALAYQVKRSWASGESVWIWGENGRRAFLKAEGYFVTLNLTGYIPSLVIFQLGPDELSWKVSRTLEADYQAWVARFHEVRK